MKQPNKNQCSLPDWPAALLAFRRAAEKRHPGLEKCPRLPVSTYPAIVARRSDGTADVVTFHEFD
jgi:hypothetical protein